MVHVYFRGCGSVAGDRNCLDVVGATVWREGDDGATVQTGERAGNAYIETWGSGPLKRDVKEVIVADTTLRVTNEGNTLVYSVMQGEVREDIYNVLTVPVGGEFRVILSDGTMVFLNSGSELRYPEAFRDGRGKSFKGQRLGLKCRKIACVLLGYTREKWTFGYWERLLT